MASKRPQSPSGSRVAGSIDRRKLIPIDNVVQVRDLWQRVQNLKKQYEAALADFQPVEKALIAAMEGGLTPALGAPAFIIEETERRNVRWKEELVARCGQATAAQILADTKPTTYKAVKFQ